VQVKVKISGEKPGYIVGDSNRCSPRNIYQAVIYSCHGYAQERSPQPGKTYTVPNDRSSMENPCQNYYNKDVVIKFYVPVPAGTLFEEDLH
jgi:hypothetical protein